MTKPLSVEKNGTLFTININKILAFWGLVVIFLWIGGVIVTATVFFVGVDNYRESSTNDRMEIRALISNTKLELSEAIRANVQSAIIQNEKIIEINYNLRNYMKLDPRNYTWKDYDDIEKDLKIGFKKK